MFQKKPPKKQKSKIFIGLLFFSAILLSINWLYTRPFMYIQSIEVHGAQTISNNIIANQVIDALESKKILSITHMHIWVKQRHIIQETLDQYAFASIEVNKIKRHIFIEVEEQAQGGIVHAKQSWALYNLAGSFVRPLTEEEILYIEHVINGIPTERILFYTDTPIIEFASQDIDINAYQDQLQKMKSFHDALIKAGVKPVIHIITDDQVLWAEVQTREGDKIRYDLYQDVHEQIVRYQTVKEQSLRDPHAPSLYDVRFNGRVFVQ